TTCLTLIIIFTCSIESSPCRSSGPIRCQRCREVCKGEVVRVQETHFHVKCFTCTVCNCDLARSGFFQKKGEYICTADYQRLYGTRCDRCDSFITGEVVSALGRTYHPKCFVCSVCSKPFPIGDRVTFSGRTACASSAPTHLSSRMNRSRSTGRTAPGVEPIKQGQSLLALEKQWHVSCFRCRTCNMVLTGEYISKDGVPYCEADYHAQYGGRVLEHYHPTCARCARCNMMFKEGEEMYLTGCEVWHPLCKQARGRSGDSGRLSEASISPPGSSIGSPSRVICARVENEILDYKDLAALPKVKAIYEVQQPDLICSSYQPYLRYTSDDRLDTYSYGEVLLPHTPGQTEHSSHHKSCFINRNTRQLCSFNVCRDVFVMCLMGMHNISCRIAVEHNLSWFNQVSAMHICAFRHHNKKLGRYCASLLYFEAFFIVSKMTKKEQFE
uniref:Actin binding LIM protein family, member 3 n=1 Tax=Salarias fasciatus TaxID=181472 RepID=A0A672FWF7_SALFA